MSWVNEGDDNFRFPGVSIFPIGPHSSRDAFVACDEAGCDEVWGIHGTGDFETTLRAEGWSVRGGEHRCPEHRPVVAVPYE